MVFGLGHNPDKFEQKALQYESKGKTAKALKNREKAAKLRTQGYGSAGTSSNAYTTTHAPITSTGLATTGFGGGLGSGLSGGLNTGIRPGTSVTTTSTTTTQVPTTLARHPISTRTPALYETNATKWEGRGNWAKAQKNREKVWRTMNPQYGADAAAPQFYNNGSFLGYSVPVGTTTSSTHGVSGINSGFSGLSMGQQGGAFPHHSQYAAFSRDPAKYEAKAQHYRQQGNERAAAKNLEKAAKLRGNTGAYPVRGFADYESKALAWEQKSEWNRAQRNREKAWRLRNPTFGSTVSAPSFYGSNNTFLGYDVPHSGFGGQTGLQSGYGSTTSIGQTGYGSTTSIVQTGYGSTTGIGQTGYGSTTSIGQTGSNLFPHHQQYSVFSRDPAKYEAKAQYYRQQGNEKAALKNLEKAAKLRTNAGAYPTRGYSDYESKATLYEQQGNWQRAQRNREKVWRLRNTTISHQTPAPNFYGTNNTFVGYDVFTTGVQSFGSTTTRVVNAAVVETHVRPVVVEQTVRTEKITEIQPVIHREVEAPHVKIIEQHVYETVPMTQPTTVTRQAIVQETVKPRIIEEIQEIVHREVAQTYVERVEQHVTENVVLPTSTSKEVIDTGITTVVGGARGGAFGGQTTVTSTTTTSMFPGYQTFGVFSRDPTKYEAKAQHYRQIGNERLALKNAEKATKLRSNAGSYPVRGFADYEAKALAYEQQRDWQRAQRNREKVWRIQNPNYGQETAAPYFYGNNNAFSGYNVPIGTPYPSTWNQGGLQSGYGGAVGGYQQLPHHKFGVFSRDPAKYEAKAQHYRQIGNEKAALKNLEKAATLRTNAKAHPPHAFADYERKALAFEQQRDWQRAQRNREKAWRLKNPKYGQETAAPYFYGNNNAFSGYDVPLGTPYPSAYGQGGLQSGLGGLAGGYQQLPHHKFGAFSRDPAKYDAKTQHYRQSGNEKLALKNAEKAAKLRTNAQAYPPRGFSDYERKALAFEQQRDWQRAQRNREKAWRVKNPNYGNDVHAPNFYGNNNSFLGYDMPFNNNSGAGLAARAAAPLGLGAGAGLNTGLGGRHL